MKKYLHGWLCFIFGFNVLLIGCNHEVQQPPLSWKTLAPTVLEKNGAEVFQYWEFKNDASIWDTSMAPLQALEAYRDSMAQVLGRDTFERILQERALQDDAYELPHTANGDSINAALVHSKAVGKVRPINNLEAQLLDYQLGRYPLLSHPTEFHGFILLHDSLGLVRVYFAASDQPWPPKPKVILEAIQNDLNQGWTLEYHLHNHYEPKSNHWMGILAPSTADAQYYGFLLEDYGLDHALITNGFHTVELRSAEFGRLRLPEER
jgi:hypothetical protein